jgi:drug/metabolite transporter (DMT)-like permease
MNLRKILGVALLAAGTLALVYRGFTYTSEKHTAHLGSLDFSLKEKKRLELPVWAGVVAIVAGAALLVLPPEKR